MRAKLEIRMKIVTTDHANSGILVCVYANKNLNVNFNCKIQMLVHRCFPMKKFSNLCTHSLCVWSNSCVHSEVLDVCPWVCLHGLESRSERRFA